MGANAEENRTLGLLLLIHRLAELEGPEVHRWDPEGFCQLSLDKKRQELWVGLAILFNKTTRPWPVK